MCGVGCFGGVSGSVYWWGEGRKGCFLKRKGVGGGGAEALWQTTLLLFQYVGLAERRDWGQKHPAEPPLEKGEVVSSQLEFFSPLFSLSPPNPIPLGTVVAKEGVER